MGPFFVVEIAFVCVDRLTIPTAVPIASVPWHEVRNNVPSQEGLLFPVALCT